MFWINPAAVLLSSIILLLAGIVFLVICANRCRQHSGNSGRKNAKKDRSGEQNVTGIPLVEIINESSQKTKYVDSTTLNVDAGNTSTVDTNDALLAEADEIHEQEIDKMVETAVLALSESPPGGKPAERKLEQSTAEATPVETNGEATTRPETEVPMKVSRASREVNDVSTVPSLEGEKKMDMNHNITRRSSKDEPIEVVSRICKSLEQSTDDGELARRSYADVAKKSNIPIPKSRSSVRRNSSNGNGNKSGIPVPKSPRVAQC